MTVQEMHVDFRMKLDKLANESNASYNSAQIDWLLNEAQIRYVRDIASKAAEFNQQAVDILSPLIVTDTNLPTTLLYTDTYYVPFNLLSNSYLYFLSGKAKILIGDCSYTVPLKYVSHDDLNSAIDDPFNSTGPDHVLFNFGPDRLLLYSSNGTVITSVDITYLKVPRKISLGNYEYLDGTVIPYSECELLDHFHTTVVDLAVVFAATYIGDVQLQQLSAAKMK